MPKCFPGVTHCKVATARNAEDMQAMGGTIAAVVLCFGNDDDTLQPIRIKKMQGVTGVTAEIPQAPFVNKGGTVWVPVLKGAPAVEAKMLALIAFDRVKQLYGMKFGKQYKVFANSIAEIGGVNGPGTTA